MKLAIKKEILLENLNNVSKAVSTKNVIPVLGGIKFNLTNEGLFLTATNNDIDIETFIDICKEENHNDELEFYKNCGFIKSDNASPMFITSLWT